MSQSKIKFDKKHHLFHATQAEVAEFIGVDRTTIRAWTQNGMPHKDNGKGNASEYDASIVFYWQISLLHRNNHRLPDMTPCRQLAVARAFSDKVESWNEERRNRSEFPDCFRQLVKGFFKPQEIEEAIAYAAAMFDITFNRDRKRLALR